MTKEMNDRVNAILNEVCHQFKVTLPQILAHRARQRLSVPRFAAAAALRRFTPLSLTSIGAILHRDHTTILSSLRQAAKTGWLPATLDRIECELILAERGLKSETAVKTEWRAGVEMYGSAGEIY